MVELGLENRWYICIPLMSSVALNKTSSSQMRLFITVSEREFAVSDCSMYAETKSSAPLRSVILNHENDSHKIRQISGVSAGQDRSWLLNEPCNQLIIERL